MTAYTNSPNKCGYSSYSISDITYNDSSGNNNTKALTMVRNTDGYSTSSSSGSSSSINADCAGYITRCLMPCNRKKFYNK